MKSSYWISFLLGFALAGLMPRAGHPHGAAQWIQDGHYKNSVGELCCGEHDCFELVDTDVVATSAGWHIKSFNETIPYSEAAPSPDGHFWRCSWPKPEDRKCFFAPPPGS